MTHTIQLPPSYFGPGIRKFVEQKLHKDVEGTCSDQYGYIISVVSISKVSQGKLIPGAGQAEYTVSYSAVVLKPFKGEVLDAIVISITKVILNIIILIIY
jgi:DNA-directed RNA polymerase II subunit RPB7